MIAHANVASKRFQRRSTRVRSTSSNQKLPTTMKASTNAYVKAAASLRLSRGTGDRPDAPVHSS